MKIGPDVPKCYYRTSVKALITDEEGRILLVKERNGGWDMPGGGLDWREAPIPALEREIDEELGCKGEIDPQPQLVLSWNSEEAKVHLVWILYKANLDVSQITPTEDVQETRFVSPDEYGQILATQEEADWECSVDLIAELRTLITR